MLDEGRRLARLTPGPRSTDAVSRHEPVLNHLGQAAQGEESAPRPMPARDTTPTSARMPAEPYRWTTPPPPPPGRPAGEPVGTRPAGIHPAADLAATEPAWSSSPSPADGPDRDSRRPGAWRGTTLGWLATLCAAATLALVVGLLSTGGGSVHTATSRQAPRSTAGPARHRPGTSPSTAGQAGGASASPATGTPPSTAPPVTGTPPSTAAPATSAPAPSAPATAPTAPAPAPPPGPAVSPPASPPGGGPVISSISPNSGPAGTAVTLNGTGFFSPSGTIVVLFGQVQAPVSCPTQQTCTASAPPQASPPSPAVPVTVTTDGGRSAPVTFTYTG